MKTQNMNLKVLLAVGAAAILFAACSKEEIDITKAEVPYGPKKHIGVNAQIITGTPDKAYMDIASYKVMWESGDQLTVNNGTLRMDEIDADDPTHAQFSGSASPNTALESGKDVYRSVFPASIINSIPNTNAPMVVTLPASQTFSQGASKVENNFMAAYTSVASGSDVDDMVFRFKNLCSVVKMVITPQSGATGVDAQISRIRLASTEGLSGNFNVTFSNGEPVLTAADPTPANLVELVYTTPLTLSGSTPVTIYAVVPPINNKALVMQIWNGDGSKIIQKQAASLTLGRSRVHSTTINQAFEDWGGAISVSNSQRVYFAGGNLQHNFAQNKWRFAHEQYSLIPDATREITSLSIAADGETVNWGSGAGQTMNKIPNSASRDATIYTYLANKAQTLKNTDCWIDLFCWGTSGDNRSGALNYGPYNTFYGYYPNGSDTRLVHCAAGQGYGFGPNNGDAFFEAGTPLNFNASQTFTGLQWDWFTVAGYGYPNVVAHQTNNAIYADWGYVHNTELNNTITDPTKQAPAGTYWRTLSDAEWTYVYGGAKRIEIDGTVKCGFGRIDTSGSGDYANGVFLIPDKMHWYMLPEGITIVFGTNTQYSTNTLTKAEFKKLESYGVVFLPACGTRLGSITHTNNIGFYWSSTTNPTNSGFDPNNQNAIATHQHAYSFKINPLDAVSTQHIGRYSQNKYDGNAVRLVRNTTDE